MNWDMFSSANIVKKEDFLIDIGDGCFNMYAASFDIDQAVELLEKIKECVIYWKIIEPTPVFNKTVPETSLNMDMSGNNKIDINLADYEALLSLPGIGAVEAKRLIEHRQQHGPFPSIDTVSEFLKLKPHHAKQWDDMVIVSKTNAPDPNQKASEPQKSRGRTID